MMNKVGAASLMLQKTQSVKLPGSEFLLEWLVKLKNFPHLSFTLTSRKTLNSSC